MLLVILDLDTRFDGDEGFWNPEIHRSKFSALEKKKSALAPPTIFFEVKDNYPKEAHEFNLRFVWQSRESGGGC